MGNYSNRKIIYKSYPLSKYIKFIQEIIDIGKYLKENCCYRKILQRKILLSKFITLEIYSN